jgi:hypothetical protein
MWDPEIEPAPAGEVEAAAGAEPLASGAGTTPLAGDVYAGQFDDSPTHVKHTISFEQTSFGQSRLGKAISRMKHRIGHLGDTEVEDDDAAHPGETEEERDHRHEFNKIPFEHTRFGQSRLGKAVSRVKDRIAHLGDTEVEDHDEHAGETEEERAHRQERDRIPFEQTRFGQSRMGKAISRMKDRVAHLGDTEVEDDDAAHPGETEEERDHRHEFNKIPFEHTRFGQSRLGKAVSRMKDRVAHLGDTTVEEYQAKHAHDDETEEERAHREAFEKIPFEQTRLGQSRLGKAMSRMKDRVAHLGKSPAHQEEHEEETEEVASEPAPASMYGDHPLRE